jgi:uncharacterized protein YuzE
MKYKKFKTRIQEYYDSDSDIKWLVLKEGAEDRYQEISPGVNIEYNDENEIIGIELLNYSKQIVKDYDFKSKDSNRILFDISGSNQLQRASYFISTNTISDIKDFYTQL